MSFSQDLVKPEESDFKNYKDFQRQEKVFKAEQDYVRARAFFHKQLRMVEIVWIKPGNTKPTVEPMLFPEPSECKYMPYESREEVRCMLDYGSEDRMSQFLDQSKRLIAEMQHLENLGKYTIYQVVGKNLSLVKWWGFFISILMNLLLLICMVAPDGDELDKGVKYEYEPFYMTYIVKSLGIFQLVLGSIILGFILASRAPLVYWEMERNRTQLEIGFKTDVFALADQSTKFVKEILVAFRPMLIAMIMVTMVATFVYFRYLEDTNLFPVWYVPMLIVLTILLGAKGARQYFASPTSPVTFLYVVCYDVITHSETAFYALYVVASALGFIGFPFFYCYHLMYLVVSSDTLQNVVRAVTQPIQALSLTFLLTFIVIYVFTMLYFFYQPERFWNDELGQNECDTLGRCYILFVRNGLLSGGGIGDYIAGELGHAPDLNDTPKLIVGTIFDLLFFVIVLILLLNIVFGIIIGKFKLPFIAARQPAVFSPKLPSAPPPKPSSRHLLPSHGRSHFDLYSSSPTHRC
jgi:inositol 1,4,5-triphosphate receptor type 3